MKEFRPYRFPPLAHVAGGTARSHDGGGAEWHASVAEGFEQGRNDGYAQGLERGQRDGYEAGRAAGLAQGRAEGRAETMVSYDTLARPLDAIVHDLKKMRAEYRSAQRREVVDLVAKVARQVIRAELALQPVQLLSLVDETLASMPPTRERIEVYLNPEELKRIAELDPRRASRWNLIADARLDAGEIRVRAGDNEADAGCHQRLSACMDQVNNHLQNTAEAADQAADQAADNGAPPEFYNEEPEATPAAPAAAPAVVPTAQRPAARPFPVKPEPAVQEMDGDEDEDDMATGTPAAARAAEPLTEGVGT
jgi:flagellar assembly protein FliH